MVLAQAGVEVEQLTQLNLLSRLWVVLRHGNRRQPQRHLNRLLRTLVRGGAQSGDNGQHKCPCQNPSVHGPIPPNLPNRGLPMA